MTDQPCKVKEHVFFDIYKRDSQHLLNLRSVCRNLVCIMRHLNFKCSDMSEPIKAIADLLASAERKCEKQ